MCRQQAAVTPLYVHCINVASDSMQGACHSYVFAMGAQFTFPNIDEALAGANQLSSWREIVKVSPIFPSCPTLQDVSAWQCPVTVVLRACDDDTGMQLLPNAWRLGQCELVFLQSSMPALLLDGALSMGLRGLLTGVEDMQASSLGDAVRSSALVGTSLRRPMRRWRRCWTRRASG